MPKSNLILADDFATDYDRTVLENGWIGPGIIFDMVKNKLKPNSEILDLGIGTGESSRKFDQAGCIVTGIDGSAKMLFECKKKGIGSKLILHDLEKTPFPLKNNKFDVVISNGVFHLIYPVEPVFSEIKRILKSKGFFVFTYENTRDKVEANEIQPGIWERKTKTGVCTYKYTDNLISAYLSSNNFQLISKKNFIAFTSKKEQKPIWFNAILALKQ